MIKRIVLTTNGQGTLNVDHGFQLYSCLSATLPILHGCDALQVVSMRGTPNGNQLRVTDPVIEIRGNEHDLIEFIPALRHRSLNVGHVGLVVKSVTLSILQIASVMRSRIVTIKSRDEIDVALTRAFEKRDLCSAVIGRRRVMRVCGKKIVGHGVVVSDLTQEQAYDLASRGVGGRRRMGAGVFTC